MIDIIGNVFSYERPLYRDFNMTERDNLFVLTILTQKFQYVLSNEYYDEFSRYLNLTSINTRHRHQHKNDSSGFECDFEKYKASNYKDMEVALTRLMLTPCKHRIRDFCNNHTSTHHHLDDDFKRFCDRIHQEDVGISVDVNDNIEKRSNRNGVQLNDFAFNKQLVFSEHFNLFDFITSIMMDDEGGDASGGFDEIAF